MKELINRLNLLLKSGVLHEENMKTVLNMLNYLKEKYDLNLTEENSSMLVTHIAMYLERKNKESIEGLDIDSLNELKESKKYTLALQIIQNLEKDVLGPINDSEKTFILAHLINFLEGVDRVWKLL